VSAIPGLFDFLDPESRERILFESAIPQNIIGGQRRSLSNLFAPTFNRFLGQIGPELREGGISPLTFRDFLSNQFDPQRQLLRLPSISPSSASPVTPTVFNFPR